MPLPDNYDLLWTDAPHEVKYQAFLAAIAATDEPVDWAYQVRDDLLQKLTDRDNHHRAIAAQLLCGLAKSDPEKRILRDFPSIFAVTRDPRFVTARHCLQSLWKIAAAGPEARNLLTTALENRFHDCAPEKNARLIRFDILGSLRRIHDTLPPSGSANVLKTLAFQLIESVEDPKYRKKYSALWKSVPLSSKKPA